MVCDGSSWYSKARQTSTPPEAAYAARSMVFDAGRQFPSPSGPGKSMREYPSATSPTWKYALEAVPTAHHEKEIVPWPETSVFSSEVGLPSLSVPLIRQGTPTSVTRHACSPVDVVTARPLQIPLALSSSASGSHLASRLTSPAVARLTTDAPGEYSPEPSLKYQPAKAAPSKREKRFPASLNVAAYCTLVVTTDPTPPFGK